MGTKLSVSLEGTFSPDTAPRVDRPPTFDPHTGFEKPRKVIAFGLVYVTQVREMKATWEEMDQFNLKPGQRDYCAHHLIDLMKCQTKYAPFAGHACEDSRNAWDKCEYEDHLMRIKEFERERRLLQRKQRKEAQGF